MARVAPTGWTKLIEIVGGGLRYLYLDGTEFVMTKDELHESIYGGPSLSAGEAEQTGGAVQV